MKPLPVPALERLLGGMSAEQFLAEYWQRRPLLVRDAIPGFRSPISGEELAGLALEEDIESRLVLEHGERPWELRRGPFAEDDFTTLPESHWTLLVQDVEKHLPELAALIEPFRFLPDWRIDDLMISYAAPAGSVGPHVDQYDVFLLQAHGERRWQIQYPAPREERLLPDLELRILAEFEATDEWLARPGDLLYLPPGVPHYGVAVDECMTYSIGFRAPSDTDLLDGFSLWYPEQPAAARRFADLGRAPTTVAGELAGPDRERLRQLLRERLQPSDEQLDRFLGQWLTEPKPLFTGRCRETPLSPAQLRQRLAKAPRLQRNPAARLLLIRGPQQSFLYADGEEYPLSPGVLPLAERLAETTRTELGDLALDKAAIALLTALVNADVLDCA